VREKSVRSELKDLIKSYIAGHFG